MADGNLTESQLKALEDSALAAGNAAQTLRAQMQGLSEGTDEYSSALGKMYQKQMESAQAFLVLKRNGGDVDQSVESLKKQIVEANLALAENKAKIEAASAALKEYNQQASAGYEVVKNLADQVGLMGNSWENASSSVLMTKGGLAGAGKAFLEIINPINLAGSVVNAFVSSTIQLTMAFDESSVALNKQTGMANRFEDQISSSESKLRSIGVAIEEVSYSYEVLSSRLGTFTDMSTADQSTMADGIATLDKFGISADQTAGTIATMTASMGMSGTEAVKLQKSLFLTAQENGISTNKMMADFANVADDLAALGEAGVDAFGDLAVAAEKSNMAVSDLIGITSKFDTFEGAARSVGSLNAVLGGPFLNSLEMVMATDPTERMRMLQGALIDSGKAFADMSYYERKAVADAAGLESVSDLAKVMKGNFDGLAGGIAKTDEELMALDQQSTDFNSLMDEVKQTVRAFALELKPAVDFLKGMLQKFQDLDPKVKKVILGMAAAGVAAKLMGSFFSKSTQTALSQAEANESTANSLSVYTDALKTAVKIGLVALPVLYLLYKAATAIGKAFAGAGDLSSMFTSLGDVDIFSFGKASAGIKEISGALNTLQDGKAIQVATVFDSAAAMAATSNINLNAATSNAKSAASPSSSGASTVVPIEITTKLEIDGRHIRDVVTKHSPALQLASSTARNSR